jgi:hypothetical protein
MSYVVKDDEVAIILKPHLTKEGEWYDGIISTGMYYSNRGPLDRNILEDLIKCASLMAAFFDVVMEKPELLEEIEDKLFSKDELEDRSLFWESFRQDKQDQHEEDPLKKKNNVVYLHPWTKTEGEA